VHQALLNATNLWQFRLDCEVPLERNVSLGKPGFRVIVGTVARNSKRIRRTLGLVFLSAALLMLLLGETALKGRLEEMVFIVYWMACFLFTFLTMIMAFLDLAALRRDTREDHRALVEQTIQEIEQAKERKARHCAAKPKK
jgi:hypothetical protein